MGNAPSVVAGEQHRNQLAIACRSIERPASRAAARLLLETVPRLVFSELPLHTEACYVDDDCIGVLAGLVEDYAPSRVPYFAAEQWVTATPHRRAIEELALI